MSLLFPIFFLLSNVSSCCLLIPHAGAAQLECIILIGPGEGDRLVGLLLGLRGEGVRTEGEKSVGIFALLYTSLLRQTLCPRVEQNKREPVAINDSSPTKQPTTTITGHLANLTTSDNPLSTASTSNHY